MKKQLLLGLFILFPFGMMGQEVLSLQNCREMALQHNKEMAAAVKQTQGARYMQKSLKGNFFPNFSAYANDMYGSMDGSLNIPGGNLPVFIPVTPDIQLPIGFAYFPGIDLNLKMKNVFMGGVMMEQPLYMGGKIFAAYKMSKLGVQASRLNERLTASEVILETENAYALLVKAKEMQKVAVTYNALLKELMKVVDSAHKHGLKPKNDVLKVQVKLNESELSIRKAENACRLATMNLCHLIGKPLTSELEIDTAYPHVTQGKGENVATITDRPEYAMLDKKMELAKQEVKLQRSELLPKVGVRGSYDYINGLKVNQQKLFDKGSFSVMVNVTVPIFHFGERYNKVRASKMKLEQIRLEQSNLNEKMMLELTQAENNLDEAKLEAELADRSLEQASENQRVSKGQYEAGLETLSDHLEAQALWQQAYATQVDAHFQLYLQYVNYLKASGRLVK